MKALRFFGILMALGSLAACQHTANQPKEPIIIIDPLPPQVQTYEMGKVEMAEALSNENVIVYSVDGDLDENRREFPEYRSVLENTTAGGYTVFDPSVTVYAVEGGGMKRPSYLPHYSVPQYAEQYRSSAPAIQLPMYQGRAQPLTPMGVVPLKTPVPLLGTSQRTRAGAISRPWLASDDVYIPPTVYRGKTAETLVPLPRAPQVNVEYRPVVAVAPQMPPMQEVRVSSSVSSLPDEGLVIRDRNTSNRRSPPMLTGY